MPTFHVHITETLYHVVTVEADSIEDANSKAIDRRNDSTVQACTDLQVTDIEGD